MKSLFFIPICALAGMVLSSCGKDDISAFNSKTDSSSSTTQAAGTDDTGSDIDTDAADDYVAATTFGRTVTVTFSSGGDNALFCFKSPDSGGNGLYIFSDQLKSGSSYSLAAGVTVSDGTSYLAGNWIEDATISGGSSSTVSAK